MVKRAVLRQRALFILMLISAGLAFYFNVFLRPALTKISSLKKQKDELLKQERQMGAQSPDLDKAQGELEYLRRGLDELKLKADNIEKRLLPPDRVPLLVTEMIKRAQGLSLDFQSIKQKQEDLKMGFSGVRIELKYESSYEDAINYIKRAEEIFPFIKVEEIKLGQAKAESMNFISVSLNLSAILAQSEGRGAELFTPLETIDKSASNKMSLTGFTPAAVVPGEKLKSGRNIFLSRLRNVKVKTGKFKLAGITYRGEGGISSAIINDTIVKAGDEIEGHKVEKILLDSVVINDGTESSELRVER